MTSKHLTEPVAIVGSACRFPGGANSPAALWKLLESPRDVCVDIPTDRFDTTTFYHPDGNHHGTTNVKQSYLLEEDIRVFDAAFFNISPNEADSMDPQQAILMETVYEALEAGGHALDNLRGSDTAVYAGNMTGDYNDTLLRDLNTVPTYFATGTSRAIISNRVSYFFDWHGPSMTIDTACSSSLIAVHQGVKALRTGESRIAVATGTQVILNPEMYINESKLKMLSPTSRGRMWDASADGYARGEGVAVVVLKLLSDAIADGDNIECIIRETGANQDGFSNGITVPTTEAQAALIRQTYQKAGLDPENNIYDRPQFFEAHGTGTQAGDPKEAAAIYESFGGNSETPLLVGSIKTVIGHLEGAAGLAGLLKGAAMIQHGFTTPNLLFERLNPKIEPFYKGLKVSTQLTAWPKLPEGVPRRVSVNSFGFGGANAHAILEQYQAPAPATSQNDPSFSPFVFSASSETSLLTQLNVYSDHLKANHANINASDLAWTLQSRRSQLPYKAAFSALNLEQLRSKIDAKVSEVIQNSGATIGTRSNVKTGPRLLGVFTGQGAQWPAMGAQLIRSSEFVRRRIGVLEKSLASLPSEHRPTWSLVAEMLAGDDEQSRIGEAALSQPLCTVVQIVLVDLLRAAGINFTAVVGHSSGEIGAAYAAGFLSDVDALRVAYYRGLFAKLAGSETTNQKGAMLAVGTSWEDAEELVNLRAFKGRLSLAAHNSPASVTLSGDADAVIHAKKVFDEEKKFARLLQVDTAYHSHHMLQCSDPYIQALRNCGVKVNVDRPADAPAWFSSVTASDKPVEPSAELQDIYWRDNMCSAVLFSEAVKDAVASDENINLAIEVGPHPALKGPAAQNIADVRTSSVPYTGVLSRGKDDVEAFSDALGFVWSFFPRMVDFQSFEKKFTGNKSRQPQLVTGLPKYQWNHARTHWTESRISRKMRQRKSGPHEILGFESPNSNSHDLRWLNVLKPSEISWLDGHQLQGQIIFPAAGYVAMALEASRSLAGDKSVELFELHNLAIPRAITFEDGDSNGVETLVALTSAQHHKNSVTADFACYSTPVLSTGSGKEMELMARGTVHIIFGTPDVAALCCTPAEEYNMVSFDIDSFYKSLAELGYGYHGPFKTISSMKRRLNQSSVLIDSYSYTDDDQSKYLVHPSTLDVAFQSSILAYSAPGDGRLWTLSVPTSIGVIRVNPQVCALQSLSGYKVPVCATLDAELHNFSGNIDMFSEDSEYGMIQIEDLIIKPFAKATKADDRVVFTHTKLGFYTPDGVTAVDNMRPTAFEVELATVCERVSYYYIRKWKSELSDAQWIANEQQPHWGHLFDWVNEILSKAYNGHHPTIKKEWSKDSPKEIQALISKYRDESIDIKLIQVVGENLPAAVRGETTILEHMLPNNMLDDLYKKGLGFDRYNNFLARTMKQVTHRYPHAKILEIGAGTGGATKAVLESIGANFSSYTYTDVSVGFFSNAEKIFEANSDKMTFKIFDAEQTPESQGYEPRSYDIIIASNVLHATKSMQRTLENTRKLLKPGGYLMLMEVTGQAPVRFHSVVGGLPGWWLGVHDGRKFSPLMTPGAWNSALRKAGFGGVDAITPEVNGVAWPLSIIVSQAVDDKVSFLRKPLSGPKSQIQIESLVILGNQSLESSQLGEELVESLGRFCGETTILDGLPTEDEALNLNPASTFINLVDLDEPIFQDITDAKMDGLKRMLELSKHVIWVTQGAQLDQPYHNGSIAFVRTLRQEETHISLNSIDISGLEGENGSTKAIAEYVLRQVALDAWNAPPSVLATPIHRKFGLLWSKEYEVFVDRTGKLQIPRLVKHEDQNARLNSSRRVLTKALPIATSNVSISLDSADAPPQVVEQIGGRRLQDSRSGEVSIKTQSSSLLALNVAADIFLFLGIGQGRVFFSDCNSSEVKPLASVALPPSEKVDTNPKYDELLIAIASELIAESLVGKVSTDSHVLIHASCKDSTVASALSRRANAKEICVSFSCDSEEPASVTKSWLKINSRAADHTMRRRLRLLKPTHFVDLTSGSDSLSLRIAQAIPSDCTPIDSSTLFRHQSSSLSVSYDPQALESRLKDAVSRTRLTKSDLVIPLDSLSSLTYKHAASCVRWQLDGLIEVAVHPLNAQSFFSKEKTYLLVGLTGQLGQSLCEWMVSNGAGCVVLTSRHPNIDKRWLDSFQGSRATVKVMIMDVLDKNGLKAVVEEIRATCPQIGGVANGAMVLGDSLFSNMSGDVMRKVLGPKVDGSRNLDEVFYSDNLDFFVLFSSVASLVGNAGQSNYAVANAHLQGLARQRRRRGLAASVVDVGHVKGIGYIETASDAVHEQLRKFKMAPISEIDLRQVFGETIQTGYPVPNKDQAAFPDTAVTSGVRTFDDDEDIKGPWFVDPIFSHIITESPKVEVVTGDKENKSSLPVRQRLAQAINKEEINVIIQDVFSTKLRTMLQLGDQIIDRDAPMLELGIDSLVAVEVRSWFLKELSVDIPVLRIVGGASVAELCEKAVEKLPKELEPAGGGENPSDEAEPARKAAPPNLEARPVSRNDGFADSDSTSTPEDSSDTPLETPATEISGETTPTFKFDGSRVTEFGSLKSAELSPRTITTAAVRKFIKSERISLPQSRFWYLHHLLEDQTAPNVAFSYHMTGELRIADLEKAIRIVTTRHEALRTCFVGDEANPEEAYQKVLPSSPLRLERKTINSEQDIEVEYKKLQKHIFDLENGDVMRLILLELSSSNHFLLVNYHHIVMDGVSFLVFLADLEKVYSGKSLGTPPRQYPDISAAQHRALDSGEMSDELNYWRRIFPAGEQPPVLPLLPVARTSSRIAMKNFDSHQVGRWLDPTVQERVKSIAKAQRSTPFHVHLAAFKTMLFCFAGPETKDLTIGIADAARNDSDVKGSIGFFLNLLTLRFRRYAKQSFAEAITEARDTTYAALGTSRLPFDVLLSELNVTRSSLHSPFFQAFLDYRQGTPEKQQWGNVELAFSDVHPGRTAYDITLDVADNSTEAYITVRVQKSLYDMTAANLLLKMYFHFLDAVTRNASLALKDTQLFGELQLNEAVKVGRGPDMVSDWPETLIHRIDQVAKANGDKVALADGIGKSLTYSEMINRIEAVAEALQKAGIGAGSRVLVFQQPSVNWACSMLAIMRIGAIYVPLDLRNPVTRLAAVAKDCEAIAVLADASTVDEAPQLQIDIRINVSSLGQNASTCISNRAESNSPAAILYTSGSTGTPKGIVVTHAGLRNEIEGYTKTWGLKAERVLQQSAMTFNHSSDQIYTGLVNGGMVYVVPAEQRGDPLSITKILQEQAITYTKATPSEYLLWLQYGYEKLQQASKWRFAFAGGEQLTSVVTDGFATLGLSKLVFHNSYGPTEISISSHKMVIPYTDKEAVRNLGRIPCGYSLPNYRTYIVDEQLKPVPIGMPGEVCIGGAGVSLGYLNNHELTDQHFIKSPFATPDDIARGWTRMYRTGDIGYLREDGALVYHSRIVGDTQVKIRGIRIELSDIESSIVAAAGGILREAVVTVRDDDLIVVHVVFAPQQSNVEDKNAFLERLLSQLPIPQYMIPVVAIPVDKFPVNNHAKVDRKAIQAMPLPERTRIQDTPSVELTETMLQLKLVWEQVLAKQMERFDFNMTPSTDFFFVGGNSLLAIRLQAQIQKTFAITIPLVKLIDASTLGAMAIAIEESANASEQSVIDWELETRPPTVPNFLGDVHTNPTPKDKKTLLLTGATGFTAKFLLPVLVAREDVETIHCVAMREKQRQRELFVSPKVVYHKGDLSSPLFGLTEDVFHDLANQVDSIIHLGAARGFFDKYQVLRPSNVHPTKELAKLAATRHTPIHYFSTIGVLPRGIAHNAQSAANHTPAADGNHGYAASKWAGERILERSAAELGVPSSIYRFVPSPLSQEDQDLEEKEQFRDELSRLIVESGNIPHMKGWSGQVDFAPANQATQWLANAFTSAGAAVGTTQFFHYASPISLEASELHSLVQGQATVGFDRIPLFKWFGRIKSLGLGYLLTSQDTTVDTSGTGQGAFESRR